LSRTVAKPDDTLARLVVMLDIAVTSQHQGEAENALGRALPLMRRIKLRFSDLLVAMVERDRALDLVKQYVAKLDQLEGENQRLRANGHTPQGTLGARLWVDASLPASPASRHAHWVLGLEAQGHIHLTEREVDFLGSCSRRRNLSEAMEDWLQDILRNVVARTGRAPPP
jgi:hypothetical protein